MRRFTDDKIGALVTEDGARKMLRGLIYGKKANYYMKQEAK